MAFFSSGYSPYDYSGINWGSPSGGTLTSGGGGAVAGGGTTLVNGGGGGGGGGGIGGYNLSPAPTSGQGAYGAVPGQLGLPNPLGDLVGVLPQLPQINAGVSGALSSASRGELAPDVIAQIQDNAANFGVTSGMPGSGLARNRGLRDLGRTSLDQTHWAAQAYPGFVGAVSGTQTVNPALQNEIATQNALNRAAPDPNKAASAAQKLFNDYLARIGNSGGQKAPTGGYGGYGNGGGFALPGFDPSAGTGQVPTAATPSGGVRSGVNDSYPGAAPTWDTYQQAVDNFTGPLQNDPRALPPVFDSIPGAAPSGWTDDPFDLNNLFDPNYGG